MRWLLLLVALSGCNPGRNAAVQALDATDVAMAQAALLSSTADSLGTISISTGDEAAAQAALAWPGMWAPDGCLVVTTTPATINAVFNDCSGPYGLSHVSGGVAILFTSTTSSASGTRTISATAEGVGFSANGAVFDVQAAATWRIDATSRELTVAAQGAAADATGAHGTAVTQQAGYTAKWENGCVTLDGAWQSVVDSHISQLAVTGYEICTGMCPSTGGQIVSTMVGGLFSTNVVTIRFDGSAKASYTGIGAGTIALECP